MEMVGHKAISEQLEMESELGLEKQRAKNAVVLDVKKYVLPAVAAGHDMINCTGKVNAGRACHYLIYDSQSKKFPNLPTSIRIRKIRKGLTPLFSLDSLSKKTS